MILATQTADGLGQSSESPDLFDPERVLRPECAFFTTAAMSDSARVISRDGTIAAPARRYLPDALIRRLAIGDVLVVPIKGLMTEGLLLFLDLGRATQDEIVFAELVAARLTAALDRMLLSREQRR